MGSIEESGREYDEPRLVATNETLESFQDDVQYLWCPSDIPVYDEPPSALNFLRNHVAVSRPCIIRNSILTRDSTMSRMEEGEDNSGGEPRSENATVPLQLTLDDLVRCFRTNDDDTTEETPSLPPLCVDVTPDGHGDCLRNVIVDNETGTEKKIFVKPMESKMAISDFCRRLRRGRHKQQMQEGERENTLDRVFSGSSELSETCDEVKEDETDAEFWEDCVLYYSRQNDCLRQELTLLWNMRSSPSATDENNSDSYLFPRSFSWAEEAFFGNLPSGAPNGPDAVNLWMGDERAVSAMHKDHYENLFYVLSGEKVFGLCPPSDAPFLYEREVTSGRFRASMPKNESFSSTGNGDEQESDQQRQWSVVLDRDENDDSTTKYSKVHWIATDLFGKDFSGNNQINPSEEFPLSRYAHPITVHVKAGELLYLPSLWFHRVTQTRETIGINYWYDMNFESPMWCYFHFLQKLRSEPCAKHPRSADDIDGR
mmetsp:Transcript_26708/g.62417  ORF Transcript_26708/g.62417 Transcript_26708/m.62417 type:complete len:485 (+) Transcript_26708:132-1586(+)